jgi:hypothetical protein
MNEVESIAAADELFSRPEAEADGKSIDDAIRILDGIGFGRRYRWLT